MRVLESLQSGGTGAPGGQPASALRRPGTTSAMMAALSAEGFATVAAPFADALTALARTDERVIALTGERGAAHGDLGAFARAFPDRLMQMGPADQVLIAAASGLAREGFIPFATTYAASACRRAYDIVATTAVEPPRPLKLMGLLPGLASGAEPTRQAPDDIAIFRSLPNLTIVDPCDAEDVAAMVPAIAALDGPVYARLPRGGVPLVLKRYRPDYRFELGKAQLVRDGRDVLVIASGLMTMRALQAAERLAADRIDVAVLHVPTIKPLDVDTILAEAARGGRLVVTAENHSRVGGLGEAVAAVLLRDGQAPVFRMIGLPDAVLDAGALPALHERYGLSAERIVADVKGWLQRHPILGNPGAYPFDVWPDDGARSP